MDWEKDTNLLELPEDNVTMFDKDHDDSRSTTTTQENLEELVTHLVQHNIHLQMLLDKQKMKKNVANAKKKQRRLIMYDETSDTEDEQEYTSRLSKPRNILDKNLRVDAMDLSSNVNLTEQNTHSNDLDTFGNLDDVNVNENYRIDSSGTLNLKRFYNIESRDESNAQTYDLENKMVTECSSTDGHSMYSSIISYDNSEGNTESFDINSIKNNSNSEYSSIHDPYDKNEGVSSFGARRRVGFKNSDRPDSGLKGIFWSSRKIKDKKFRLDGDIPSNSEAVSQDIVIKDNVRRTNSFNEDLILENVSASVYTSRNPRYQKNQSSKNSSKKVNSKKLRRHSTMTDTEDNMTDCSGDILGELDTGIHPQHKVYKNVHLSKQSLKNILRKLTASRQSMPTIDDGFHVQQTSVKAKKRFRSKSSGRVSNIAKKCTKTFKEKVRQIITDDELDDESKCDEPSLLKYQLGTSKMGAKIAENKANSIFRHSMNVRLSDTPYLSTQPNTFNGGGGQDEDKTTFDQMDESDSKNICHYYSSSSNDDLMNSNNFICDGYYEKSFDMIEHVLEEEVYRDSAIYSDPEDISVKISAADITKNLPSNILDRVSKSPSFRNGNNTTTTKVKECKENGGKNFNASGDIDCSKQDTTNSISAISNDPISVVHANPNFEHSSDIQPAIFDDAEQNILVSNFNNLEYCQNNNIFDASPIQYDSEAKTSSSYSNDSKCINSTNVYMPEMLKCKDQLVNSNYNLNSKRSSLSDYRAGSVCNGNAIILNQSTISNIDVMNGFEYMDDATSNNVLQIVEVTDETYVNECKIITDTISSHETVSSNPPSSLNLSDQNEVIVNSITDSLNLNDTILELKQSVNLLENGKKVPPPIPKKPERGRNRRRMSEVESLTLEISHIGINNEKAINTTCNSENLEIVDRALSKYDSKQTSSNECISFHRANKEEKPPQSPMMSVRSLVRRSFGKSSFRKLRASCIIDEPSEKTSYKSCESDSQSSVSVLTRKGSFKALGSYIGRLGQRSTSVPPKIDPSIESRRDFKPPCDAMSQSVVERSKSPFSRFRSKRRAISVHKDIKPDEYPFTYAESPCDPSKVRPYNEFVNNTANNSKSNLSNSKSIDSEEFRGRDANTSRSKRTKGWVRHVVGKLQHMDD